MVMWPWTWRVQRDAAIAAHERTAQQLDEQRARAVRWAKRWSTVNDGLSALRPQLATAEADVRHLTERVRSLEQDLDLARGDLRRVMEQSAAALSASRRSFTVPRDVFDEDTSQPTQFVDTPGATAEDIESHIQNARALRG